jgi:hypothetical protein
VRTDCQWFKSYEVGGLKIYPYWGISRGRVATLLFCIIKSRIKGFPKWSVGLIPRYRVEEDGYLYKFNWRWN